MQYRPKDNPKYHCGGKNGYSSWSEANHYLRSTVRIGRQKRINGPDMRLSVYRCRYCHLWHVGHGIK